MIFAHVYNGNKFYSYGISKKNVNGDWETAYKDCKFKKDVDLEDRTLIKPIQAWESFYKKDGKAYFHTFINEFEIVDNNNDDDINLDDILGETPDVDIESLELPFDEKSQDN